MRYMEAHGKWSVNAGFKLNFYFIGLTCTLSFEKL